MSLFKSILNIVPRPWLIKISYLVRPIIALTLKGNKFTDPIDGKSFRKFLPYGYGNQRENALSPSTLSLEINDEIQKSRNNLIKIDSQGSEIKILKGLGQFINLFEVIILEVSLHQYNKNAPLFNEMNEFMISKDFRLYDIFDLKRLGNNKSFLVQFDCVFIRKDSDLLNVKF